LAIQNVDIVKINNLTRVSSLTDNDVFIVSDVTSSGNVVTKSITSLRLSTELADKVKFSDIGDVDLNGLADGNTIVWDDVSQKWVPSVLGSGSSVLTLDAFNVTNLPTPRDNGSLSYNKFRGLFEYTPPDISVENLSDYRSGVISEGDALVYTNGRWQAREIPTTLNVTNANKPVGVGGISLNGNDLVYTPPSLSLYLETADLVNLETDPVFQASPAAGITEAHIDKWNNSSAGVINMNDLGDVITNGYTLTPGMVLSWTPPTDPFNPTTEGRWLPKRINDRLRDLSDVSVANRSVGNVLQYDGVNWVNGTIDTIDEVFAGNGLSGGGTDEVIRLDVVPGRGIKIENDAVAIDATLGMMKDVFITTANDGNVLTYDQRSLSWVTKEHVQYHSVTDLLNTAPQEGQVLTYVNGEWQSKDIVDVIVDQTPDAGPSVKVWGYLRFVGGQYEIKDGSRAAVGSGYNFGVYTTTRGTVSIRLNPRPNTTYFSTTVTAISPNIEHTAAVRTQGINFVELYTKKINSPDNIISPDDMVSMSFQIVY